MQLSSSQKRVVDNLKAICADWKEISKGNIEGEFYVIPEEIIEESYGNGGILNSNTDAIFDEIMDNEISSIIKRCENIFSYNEWNIAKISNDIDFSSIQSEARIILNGLDL